MSNPWRAEVNQKLYFTQLLLDQAATQTGPAQQAQLQGAVFHLASAYRLYLKEIAQHQRHETDADNARTACRQFAAKNWTCQELNELACLEEVGQWPAQLLAALREAEGATARSSVKPAKSGELAISLADVTEEVDIGVVSQWLARLQKLVEAQRESAQEW